MCLLWLYSIKHVVSTHYQICIFYDKLFGGSSNISEKENTNKILKYWTLSILSNIETFKSNVYWLKYVETLHTAFNIFAQSNCSISVEKLNELWDSDSN